MLTQKEQSKKYYLNNTETLLKKSRAYYNANKIAHYEVCKRWRKKNKMRTRFIVVRARIRGKYGNIGDFKFNEWLEILKKHDFKCKHCGATKDLSEDHIIPLSKSGRDSKENIQVLCRSCNSKKSAKDFWDEIEKKERLPNGFIKSREACKILNISRERLRQIRPRLLSMKVGKRYLYKKSSILQYPLTKGKQRGVNIEELVEKKFGLATEE